MGLLVWIHCLLHNTARIRSYMLHRDFCGRCGYGLERDIGNPVFAECSGTLKEKAA